MCELRLKETLRKKPWNNQKRHCALGTALVGQLLIAGRGQILPHIALPACRSQGAAVVGCSFCARAPCQACVKCAGVTSFTVYNWSVGQVPFSPFRPEETEGGEVIQLWIWTPGHLTPGSGHRWALVIHEHLTSTGKGASVWPWEPALPAGAWASRRPPHYIINYPKCSLGEPGTSLARARNFFGEKCYPTSHLKMGGGEVLFPL